MERNRLIRQSGGRCFLLLLISDNDDADCLHLSAHPSLSIPIPASLPPHASADASALLHCLPSTAASSNKSFSFSCFASSSIPSIPNPFFADGRTNLICRCITDNETTNKTKNRQERCIRCMVINQKHANVLQVRFSFLCVVSSLLFSILLNFTIFSSSPHVPPCPVCLPSCRSVDGTK